MRSHPVRIWAWIFIALNLFCDLGGGTNVASRYAMLCAMAEDHSFAIDSYLSHTADWSISEEGKHYSNKGPGPALLAFPVFWVMDRLSQWGTSTRQERDERRRLLRFTHLKILSLLFQVIPLLILGWAVIGYLDERQISLGAKHWTAVALWLGSSAALYLNNFWGHGMAAVAILGAWYFILRERWIFSGLFFGFAVLADYPCGLVALPMGAYVLSKGRGRGALGWIAGGVLPGILWIWYHSVAFGHWLSLPIAHENPEFHTLGEGAVWGQFHLLPSSYVLGELIWGGSRGVLWTNPWLILVLCLGIFFRNNRKMWGAMALSFVLVFAVNANFGAWHGGPIVAPRYWVSVLPATALWVALNYDLFPWGLRAAFVGTLAMGVILNGMIFFSGAVPQPGEALWPFFSNELWNGTTATAISRMVGCALAGVIWWLWDRKQRWQSSPRF